MTFWSSRMQLTLNCTSCRQISTSLSVREDMWAAVSRQEMLQRKTQILAYPQARRKSCNREWVLFYGDTNLKGATGVEYVPRWPTVCVVTVVQIMNHFAPGFAAWETDSWKRMVCLCDGLRLILCSCSFICAFSHDPKTAGSFCTFGLDHIDLH